MIKEKIFNLYKGLFKFYGPQYWWPADTPFEVMVGAILTQHTSWENVVKAITNLKNFDLLSFKKLLKIKDEYLAELIRPVGFYNLKQKRLKNLLKFIYFKANYNLDYFFFQNSLYKVRAGLLSVNGIGPETADTILLYAAAFPTFVIDTYTFRILIRHGLKSSIKYDELQGLFLDNLPEDIILYSEYHSLLVKLGKNRCHKFLALCDECPAKNWKI